MINSARLAEILTLATPIAWGAADILLDAQRTNFDIEKSGDSPVTSADLAVNHHILTHLESIFGTEDFAYLTEETFQSQPPSDRLGRPWVWIIDPLDGTKDFINRTGEYATHIALAYEGRPVIAIVACPEHGTLYTATQNGGAFVQTRDGRSTQLHVSTKSTPEDLTLVGSRSHRGGRFVQLLEQFPCKTQIQMGSVGCKIAAIATQQADVYISVSGKSAPKDWDFAAPELILTEAGGQFTHFDGTPLHYNQEDVNQWGGIMVSNGTCHDRLCSIAQNILNAIDAVS